MQITKVQLIGRYVVPLPFFGLRPSNRYILKGIDGLTPPEVDIFKEKGVYQGRFVHDRQMIIRFGVNPNFAIGETVASIRQMLYGLVSPGADDSIQIQLMNGPNVVVVARGYISKFEAVPFSKDPEVQITIDCDSPYFESESDIVEVPSSKASYTIDNDGTASSGFVQTVTFTAPLSSWTLWTDPGHIGAKITLDYDFQTDDELIFDTREDKYSVRRIRGSNNSSILKAMTPESTWLQLHPGMNTFYTSSQSFSWGSVVYRSQYWGI